MVLNYLFVNGYYESFRKMSQLIGSNDCLKLITNQKQKLEEIETTNRDNFHERRSFNERSSLTDLDFIND